MERLHLGETARKTGIHAPRNLIRDKYGMEDLDAFFSDSESPPPSITRRNPSPPHSDAPFNNVARRIDFADAANYELSPVHPIISPLLPSNLRSPMPEHNLSDRRLSSPLMSRTEEYTDNNDYDTNNDFDDNAISDDIVNEYDDNDANDYDGERPSFDSDLADQRESESAGPIPNDPSSEPLFVSGEPSSHANVAPASSGRTPRDSPRIPSSLASSRSNRLIAGPEISSSQSLTPRPPRRQGTKRKAIAPRDASGSDSESDGISRPGRSLPDRNTLSPSTPKTKSTRAARTPSSYTVSYARSGSALPSPPPEGLRRSKRTRIAPLAFWRNERIVYGRAHDNIDPDTTLAQDIANIPLQEIESVVHCPEPEIRIRARKSDGTRLHAGSEWQVLRTLDAEIVKDGTSVEHRVAYTSHGADFEAVIGPDDDYEIAALYSNGDEQKASGLLEFKEDGQKLPRNSGDCLITFFVVIGELQVKLNDTRFVVLRGCTFEVPRGNLYSFKNIASGVSRLFFVQIGAFEEDRIHGDEPS